MCLLSPCKLSLTKWASPQLRLRTAQYVSRHAPTSSGVHHEGYSDVYVRFCSCAAQTVVEYICENWHEQNKL